MLGASPSVGSSISSTFGLPKRALPIISIWRSPPLPESAILARKDLDPAIREKLRQFFLTYGTGTGPDADRQREVIIAEAYRDAQKIKGEGDAKASALYADAFGRDPQFAQFYRSLEAYRASFRSKSDIMVLDPSSDFFRTMRSGASDAPAAAAPRR